MLKCKEWLSIKKNVKFIIKREVGPLLKDGKIIIPETITVVKRISDGRSFTNSSIAKVKGEQYRIREFYYDLKSVRLMWHEKILICDIDELQ